MQVEMRRLRAGRIFKLFQRPQERESRALFQRCA